MLLQGEVILSSVCRFFEFPAGFRVYLKVIAVQMISKAKIPKVTPKIRPKSISDLEV